MINLMPIIFVVAVLNFVFINTIKSCLEINSRASYVAMVFFVFIFDVTFFYFIIARLM